MVRGNDDYGFTLHQDERFVCVYGIECSGPHCATGGLVTRECLRWFPVCGAGLACGQRIGRGLRESLTAVSIGLAKV